MRRISRFCIPIGWTIDPFSVSLVRLRGFPCGNTSSNCGTSNIPLDAHLWNGVRTSRILGDSGFVVSRVSGLTHLYVCLVVWR